MSSRDVAIVGAGLMAQEHARAFASIEGVRITGVCSRKRERAERLAAVHGAQVFESVDAMYRDVRPAAVVVAVNEVSARDVCSAVFRHPWVCLLEKPVGVDLAEAETILGWARRAGAKAYVALNRRSYGATRRARTEVRADDGPRLISILDQEDMKAALERGKPEVVVRNYMFANSIHLIDYFTVFARGELVSVERPIPWTPESPGNVVATLRYDSGDTGVYQAVWDGPGPWSVTVTNPSVRLEMRPLERLGVQRRGERGTTEATPEQLDLDFKPGLRWQAEQIVRAMSGETADLATLADATRSMTLCAALYGLSTAG
ncbi:MAG: Gfo/Idh/MocA family protein [Thermoanaerobaculia bacterium]